MIFGLPPTGKSGFSGEDDWKWYTQLTRLYAAMVYSGTHFAEASYGDGEFKCMMGHKGQTSIGMVYEPWLGELLRKTLFEPVGQWCCYWGGEHKPLRQECDAWLRKHNPPVVWLSRRALPAANCHGRLGPVFRAMQGRRCVLVGPRHFRKLNPRVLKGFTHIEVTDNRAYEQIDETCDRVRKAMRPGDLVLFSSGMASPILIHRLWPEVRGEVTLWDVGAIFDPYCGVFSRKTYALKEWQRDVMPLNIPGGSS